MDGVPNGKYRAFRKIEVEKRKRVVVFTFAENSFQTRSVHCTDREATKLCLAVTQRVATRPLS